MGSGLRAQMHAGHRTPDGDSFHEPAGPQGLMPAMAGSGVLFLRVRSRRPGRRCCVHHPAPVRIGQGRQGPVDGGSAAAAIRDWSAR